MHGPLNVKYLPVVAHLLTPAYLKLVVQPTNFISDYFAIVWLYEAPKLTNCMLQNPS
jgi:hypothetical protein